MRGWNYSQRIIVMAALSLLALGGNANAAEKPMRSWEIKVPRYAHSPWEWRDQWSIEFTPYQADLMQELIEDAVSPWYPAYDARIHAEKMSKWTPWIENLNVEEEVNPSQAFSYLWWYQHGIQHGEPQMTSQMHQVLVQLRAEPLSAEWAMLAGIKCARHAEYEQSKALPDFAILAEDYFRRAQKLDPDWDLPYYEQLAMVELQRRRHLDRFVRYDDPYEKQRPSLFPSPGAVKHEAQRLMRDYMAATDFSRMFPPPWAVRDSASPLVRMGGILSAPNRLRDDAPAYVGDLLNLLIEMSIDKRNAEDLALVLDFYAASFVHEEGHLTRFLIDDAKALPWTLQHRILDAEAMRAVNEAADCVATLHKDALPEGEYRRLYPHGEITYGEAKAMASHQRMMDGIVRPLLRAAARLRELGPGAFAPAGYKDQVQAVEGGVRRASIAAWPLSEEAQRYWELLPPQTELTPQGKVAISYLLGSLMSPDWSTQRALEAAWRGRCDAIYNEPGASFEQRATAAFLHPTTERLRGIVDEWEAMSAFDRPQDAEWLYTMWKLAHMAAGTFRNTKEESALRLNCFDLSYEYVKQAAENAPEWALPQLVLLAEDFRRAYGRAYERTPNDPGSMIYASSVLCNFTEEDVSLVYERVLAFDRAPDLRRLLPPPWLCRLALAEAPEEVTQSYDLMRYLEIDDVDKYESFSEQSRYLAARCLAWHGAKAHDPEQAAEALRYLQKQLVMDPTDLGHPGYLAYVLPGVANDIAVWIANPEKRKALEEPFHQAYVELNVVRQMHQWKTKELGLGEQQKANAMDALGRRFELMRQDLRETIDNAIELVLSLQPEDFGKPSRG